MKGPGLRAAVGFASEQEKSEESFRSEIFEVANLARGGFLFAPSLAPPNTDAAQLQYPRPLSLGQE